MVAVLRHRGPDGYGFYLDDRAGLANSRLSIVGLEDGFQPLHNEAKTIWLTANGEVFNHAELRRELTARGHRFATGSDCEAIIHAYEEWGDGAFTRLEGQFAFALWDVAANRLVLVRDPFGILPLHYAMPGGAVVFASEAKALFAGGRIQAQLDAGALGQLFTTWSVLPPASVFAGVRSVRPGCALLFEGEAAPVERLYWQPAFAPPPDNGGSRLEEAVEELEARLRTAVERRLHADVPVGAYLSGGLDSAVVCRLGVDANPDGLRTFGIGFSDTRFDETESRDQVALALGTLHHDELCTTDELAPALADVVWSCESPLLRSGPVPFLLLSRSVRAGGMKTVVSGEGADELLGGYSIFKEDRVRRFWARSPESTLRPALLQRLHPYVAGDEVRRTEAWRSFFARGLTDVDDPFYSHRIRWSNNAWTLRVLAEDVRRSVDAAAVDEAVEQSLPAGWRDLPPLERAQAIELQTFMSSYLLASQGDRVAMANGIEVRYPYLDRDVVELCLRLPRRAKLVGLHDKVALRHVAARVLPADVARRAKRAYRAPIAEPFAAVASESGDDLLSPANVERFGLLDAEAVPRLAARIRARSERQLGEREEMAFLGALTLQLLAVAFVEEFDSRCSTALRALDRVAPHVLVDNRSSVAEFADA
jgi:asparagine synthase (glutamine-hydrolysing)